MRLTDRGFTLTEMLIASVLIVIILVGLVSTYVCAFTNLRFFNVRVELQSDARLAARVISSDIRKSSPSYITITKDSPSSGSDAITYRLLNDSNSDSVPDTNVSGEAAWATGTDWTIYYDASEGTVVKTDGSVSSVISGNVKNITFDNFGTDTSLYMDEVRFTLTLEKSGLSGPPQEVSVTSTINARN